MSAKAQRAWQRMLSGRRLDLLDPSPLDIEIEDIAHGLSRVARWNGQTVGAHIFSVAQHSLLVEAIAERLEPALQAAQRLAILLHDAPEYVIGDMISPFKAVIGEPSAVRPAGRAAGGLDAALKARRPHRRLPRGDAARRLLARGGAQVLRPPAPLAERGRRLFPGLADRDGAGAVPRPHGGAHDGFTHARTAWSRRRSRRRARARRGGSPRRSSGRRAVSRAPSRPRRAARARARR
jgi:hypothetical protein